MAPDEDARRGSRPRRRPGGAAGRRPVPGPGRPAGHRGAVHRHGQRHLPAGRAVLRAAGRRPLAELDADTRTSIAAAGDVIDVRAAVAAWEHARQAPAWDGRPRWIHSDLLRPNLLVAAGRLRAVIDFGSVGVGDPATDVVPAWAVFGPAGRRAFRAALDVDEATWARARGIALHQAAALVPYYAVSNPAFAELGRRTVADVAADLRAD